MRPAWNSDANLRNLKLALLDVAFCNGQLVRGRQTPFAIVLDGEAPRYADSLVGIPAPFAFLVDGIFLALPTDFGPEWGVETCKAVQPNADLSKVVPTVMAHLLESLRRLVSEQVERGSGSKDAAKQTQALEDAAEIVSMSLSKELVGTEDKVRAVFALSGLDWAAYIAQAAVEAVLTRSIPEPKTMLNADKKRIADQREANAQAAGMAALTAIRAAVELFVADAKSVALASQANDQSTIRLAEENARGIFFTGLAVALSEAVLAAPNTAWHSRVFGGGKSGGTSFGVTNVLQRLKTHWSPASQGNSVSVDAVQDGGIETVGDQK